MSSRPFSNPWPLQTPLAQASEPAATTPPPRNRSLKRRRVRDNFSASTSKTARRQVIADKDEVAEALTNCQLNSGNNVISCFPTARTVVAQNEWVTFVWNSRRPEITQQNMVEIYLFRGDSNQEILHYPNVRNPSGQAGHITAQVNDSWWGSNGPQWNGKNITYPFYWVLIPTGKHLDGNQIAQPTFSAVQTTIADSVASSISSSSASSASAASVASVVSASLASASSSRSSTIPSSASSAEVQPNSSNKDFPHWAIAVIVILGFLAIAATCVLAFLIIRRVRRRHELDSNRNSMGSSSPMMANAGGPSSPLLAGTVIGGNHPGSISGGRDSHTAQRDAPSVVMHDGASTISRTGSAANNEGPFSGADAAIMADAFRKMLRKPDFAGRPVDEGESPDGQETGEGKEEIINRELAEEGRDIRSVSSERGVRVETLSDSGDTVHDRHGRDRD